MVTLAVNYVFYEATIEEKTLSIVAFILLSFILEGDFYISSYRESNFKYLFIFNLCCEIHDVHFMKYSVHSRSRAITLEWENQIFNVGHV